jgi:DNA polymerase III delta subunit
MLLETNSVFWVFSWIVSNLRRILYIQTFQRQGYVTSEIVEILDIKPFWIDKLQKFKGNIRRLQTIFDTLVDIERATKTGEAIGDGELALELAIQRVLFTI